MTALDVSETDLARARKWLTQHGARDREPSRLLAARLAVRDKRNNTEVALLLGLGGLLVAFALARELIPLTFDVDGHDQLGVVQIFGFYVLMAGTSWWASRLQRRSEQHIADALPRRAAHSADRSPVRVLGRVYLFTVAVAYAGGIALGTGIALGAAELADQLTGLLYAVGTAVFGVVTAIVAVEEVRRPALAEDDGTLEIDDVLRTQDAHRLIPFPTFIAGIAAAEAIGTGTSAALTSYAVVTLVLWSCVYLLDWRRPLTRAAQGAAA